MTDEQSVQTGVNTANPAGSPTVQSADAQHIADEESIEEADWPSDDEEAANPPPEPAP